MKLLIIVLIVSLAALFLLVIARCSLKAMLHLHVPFSAIRPLDLQQERLRARSAMRAHYVIDILVAICSCLLSASLEGIFSIGHEATDITVLQRDVIARSIVISFAMKIVSMALLVVSINDKPRL